MRYLIQPLNQEPFLTNWFDWENNYNEGMTVYDTINWTYTKDGNNWLELEIDHL